MHASRRLDTSAAEKIPGVAAIIPGPLTELRFAGAPVAAVAAKTPEIAGDASERNRGPVRGPAPRRTRTQSSRTELPRRWLPRKKTYSRRPRPVTCKSRSRVCHCRRDRRSRIYLRSRTPRLFGNTRSRRRLQRWRYSDGLCVNPGTFTIPKDAAAQLD